MPLTFTPTVNLLDVAPGPYVELLVSGMNANLVPDPSFTSTTKWPGVIAGTDPDIAAPDTPSFWTRNTTTFATTPAALKLTTTTTSASGNFYVTSWVPALPGMQVRISAAVRVLTTDSVRVPAMRIEAKDASGTTLTVNAITWPTTVSGSFSTVTNTFSLPATAVQFRVYLRLEGTATSTFTVHFDDLSVILQPDAANITVSRIWDGEETIIQGGYEQTIVGDTMVFYDYGAPFTTDVIYKAQTKSSSGVEKESAQSSIVRVEASGVWLSDPFSPMAAIKVIPDAQSFKRLTKIRPGGPVAALTRRRRVAIVGVRQEASGVPVAFYTYTDIQRMALTAILDEVDPLMIRASSDHTAMPSLGYITFDSYDTILVDAPEGSTTRYEMKVDFVESPSLDVIVPLRTYQNYLDEFTDYNGTTYSSYLGVLRGI